MLGRRGRRRAEPVDGASAESVVARSAEFADALAGATESVDVSRARVLDGAHLWLTFVAPAAGEILATKADGASAPLATGVAAGLQTVCLSLDALPAGSGSFALSWSSGDRPIPLRLPDTVDVPTRAPVAPGAVWAYRVDSEPQGLVVHRRRARAAAPVTGVRLSEGLLEIRWPASYDGDLLLLDDQSAPVSVVDAVRTAETASALLGPQTELRGGARLTAATGTLDQWIPLVRRNNVLRRPNRSVVMPAIDLPDGAIELLWAPDGRLQVRRRGVDR